jgi:hypothetical protein
VRKDQWYGAVELLIVIIIAVGSAGAGKPQDTVPELKREVRKHGGWSLRMASWKNLIPLHSLGGDLNAYSPRLTSIGSRRRCKLNELRFYRSF